MRDFSLSLCSPKTNLALWMIIPYMVDLRGNKNRPGRMFAFGGTPSLRIILNVPPLMRFYFSSFRA